MPRLTLQRPGGVAAALLALAVAPTGCSSSPDPAPRAACSATEPSEVGAPPTLARATLEDTVSPHDDGLVAWTTTWRACFAPAEGSPSVVRRWESRAVTPEGSSPEVAEVPGGCLDLDVATGVDPAEDERPTRDLQLSDAQNLAYLVRAVHADGTVTPWTEPVRVGTVTGAG